MIEKRPRKDIFVGIYSPGKRLYEFTIEKRNVVGALAKISSTIADMGINLLSGFLTAYPEEPTSRFCFVADLTGLRVKPVDVAERLMKLDVVLSVEFRGSRPRGMMIDTLHFPLFAIGERSVVLRARSIRGMFGRLRDEFGPGASLILYNMGLGAGEQKVRHIKEEYGLTGRPAVKLILEERIAKGWCIPILVKFDEEGYEALVRAYDLFECVPSKEGEAMSQFFRGYLTGIFKAVFGRDVVAEEVKCIAKGNRFCEFSIGPR